MRIPRALAAGLLMSVAAFSAQGQGAPRDTSTPRAVPFGSAHGAVAGEQRTVRGRVVRGTPATVQPLVGAWVVLHRVGTDRAAPLDSMRSGAAGRYAFAYRTSGDPNAVYFVSSMYGGVAYFTAPLRARTVSGDEAELVVHDTTSAAVPIHVRGRHVVFAAPGDANRRTILEVYELSNDSSVTRVAAGARGLVWEGVLLDGARNASVGRADFSDGSVRFEEGRARLAAPFAPGLKQFTYSYDVPTDADYTLLVDQPADVLEVLIEDPLGRATGGRLAAQGPSTTGGRTFARFVAQDVKAGTIIRVSAPGTAEVSGSQLRILAVMAALGALLLVGLARSMYRRRGATARGAVGADELRARLSQLDETFAALASPTAEQRADHWQQRAHLTKQLSDAVAREQGLA
jgi:hypothetical protein